MMSPEYFADELERAVADYIAEQRQFAVILSLAPPSDDVIHAAFMQGAVRAMEIMSVVLRTRKP